MAQRKQLIFCTYSSIYSSLVLKRLLAENSIEIVAIINSTRVLNSDYGHLRGSIKQIQTSGWRYSVYLFMVTDFFSWIQPLLSLKKNPLKTVHGLARLHHIPLLDTRDINHVESIQFILKYKPQYLLAAHFNQLIKPAVLDLPELECLNIHPSLLPAYKGVDPVFYTLLEDQKEFGVSLHKMAESFDSGDVLLQKAVTVASSDSIFSINKNLFDAGAILAIQWLKNKDIKRFMKIQNTLGRYDSWPSAKQVGRLRKSGKRLIRFWEVWK